MYISFSGLESADCIFFMRLTCILSDIFVYYSAVYFFIFKSKISEIAKYEQKLMAAFLLIFIPGKIVIDHGENYFFNARFVR